MKLTKYEHACVVLEEQGKKLVIDPGGFTKGFGELNNIVAVVVTHEHGDHFNAEHLDAIIAANPGVKIFGPEEVTGQLTGKPATMVTGGDSADVEPFKLRFTGEMHAEIYPGHVPVPHNVGVMVNGNVYYPGDSFVRPDLPVQTLLVPVSAPWLKLGESMDFVETLKPKICIPTHNGLHNDAGEQIVKNLLRSISDKHGVQFTYLDAGQSIEV